MTEFRRLELFVLILLISTLIITIKPVLLTVLEYYITTCLLFLCGSDNNAVRLKDIEQGMTPVRATFN